MAFSPPARGPASAHSEPTCRRTGRSLHPVNATAPQGHGVRRDLATRYIIVNERVPRRKRLHSRIPRHYLLAEPPEVLELCPHHSECQRRPRRAHAAHLSQGWEDQEDQEHFRRRARTQGHASPAHHQLHFIGNHAKNPGFAVKGRPNTPRRCGNAKQEDGEEGGTRDEDGPQLYVLHQSPGRPRPLRKTRVRAEAPQTDSDSASLGSSSDQQHSSTDQYIQVIHPSDMAHKRSRTSLQLTLDESHDLLCSNV